MKKEILICLLTSVSSLIVLSIVEPFTGSSDLIWATWTVLLVLSVLFFILFCIQMSKEKKDSKSNELKSKNAELAASVKSLQRKLDDARQKADLYDKSSERLRIFYRYAVLPWMRKQVEDNELSSKSFDEWKTEFNDFLKQF